MNFLLRFMYLVCGILLALAVKVESLETPVPRSTARVETDDSLVVSLSVLNTGKMMAVCARDWNGHWTVIATDKKGRVIVSPSSHLLDKRDMIHINHNAPAIQDLFSAVAAQDQEGNAVVILTDPYGRVIVRPEAIGVTRTAKPSIDLAAYRKKLQERIKAFDNGEGEE